jgi:hypothetical protein
MSRDESGWLLKGGAILALGPYVVRFCLVMVLGKLPVTIELADSVCATCALGGIVLVLVAIVGEVMHDIRAASSRRTPH